MIRHEGRLDHLLLAEFIEEQIQDIALLMARFVSHALLVCDLLCFLIRLDPGEINACVLLHGIDHGDAFKRLRHIDYSPVVADHGASADLLSQIAEHALGEFHHALIIGIGLIELHQRELGIVAGIHTLVSENAADLIDALQTAHDQSLQIQLQGDAQLHILVQRIEMRLERSGCSTAGVRHQHGRLHLDEIPAVQELPDLLDDL